MTTPITLIGLVIVSLWNSFLTAQEAPMLLIVAFGGFRWDYVNVYRMPHLWRIVQEGVWAPKGVKNQFVTDTLPNLYSIVTGLYPENHGIIGKTMYDPDLNEHYDYWLGNDAYVYQSSRSWKWYSGKPIWQANEEGGKNRRSGAMRFPLADAKINNRTLFRTEPVNLVESKAWLREAEEDLETLLQWFLHPETPINLGLIYIDEPDATLHDNDIYSIKVKQATDDVDYFINVLNRRLASLSLRDKMNVMYVSDHGHANVYTEWNTIDLANYINNGDYKWSGKSIFPSSNVTIQDMYEKLKIIQNKMPQFQLWLKGDVPDHLHYKNNPRIGPIVVTEYLGYSILSHGETSVRLPKVRGMHDYSNEYREMWPMFVASGPAFKKGYVIESDIQTIDYYNVMCEILQVDCAPNDGDFRRSYLMLKNVSPKGQSQLHRNKASANSYCLVFLLLSYVFSTRQFVKCC